MRSYVQIEWGDICGLKSNDLPDDLLKKVKFEKLLECLNTDKRVQYIVASKILDATPNSIRYFKQILAIISKFPNIVSVYNRYIEKNAEIINCKSYWDRPNYIFWDLLNERNKEVEVLRWINKLSSVISAGSIDYKWLFKKHPDAADQLIKKVWEQKHSHSRWGQDELKYLIRNVPECKLDEVMGRVFKSAKHLQLEALGNHNLQEKYIVKALRLFAKRSCAPMVNAKITKSMLEKLPTITRLEVIEKLVRQKTKIYDIKNEDDFKTLMFDSIIRYPIRVERVVKRFRFNSRSKK